MIKSFKNKRLKRFFEMDDASGLSSGQAQKISDVLGALDTAEAPRKWVCFPAGVFIP